MPRQALEPREVPKQLIQPLFTDVGTAGPWQPEEADVKGTERRGAAREVIAVEADRPAGVLPAPPRVDSRDVGGNRTDA